jgi:hypothetical protein
MNIEWSYFAAPTLRAIYSSGQGERGKLTPWFCTQIKNTPRNLPQDFKAFSLWFTCPALTIRRHHLFFLLKSTTFTCFRIADT